MKKFLLSLMAAVAMLPLMQAQAASDDFMSFEDNNGQVKSMSSTGLSISIANGKLTATNNEETYEAALESLSGMYFSETSGVEAVAVDQLEGSVVVYNVQGVLVGEFGSAAEAVGSLPAGTYVMSNKTQTIKIAVK